MPATPFDRFRNHLLRMIERFPKKLISTRAIPRVIFYNFFDNFFEINSLHKVMEFDGRTFLEMHLPFDKSLRPNQQAIEPIPLPKPIVVASSNRSFGKL